MPFKANQDRRHHIPKQRHRVTNWAAYDIALRQRGSLTVWFSEAAIVAWKAEPRATRGGQPRYSALAITTALTLRAVFRLALRQTEGLVASLLRLLCLDLAAPDHSTLSRRGETLPVSRPRPPRGSRFGRMIPEPHTIGAGRLSCCLSPGIGNGKHGPQPGPPLPPQGGASGLDAYLGSRRESESDQPERDGHVCYDCIVHCRRPQRRRPSPAPLGFPEREIGYPCRPLHSDTMICRPVSAPICRF